MNLKQLEYFVQVAGLRRLWSRGARSQGRCSIGALR
jgi:hypothetical protein